LAGQLKNGVSAQKHEQKCKITFQRNRKLNETRSLLIYIASEERTASGSRMLQKVVFSNW